mgnify:CR=1 FL=1
MFRLEKLRTYTGIVYEKIGDTVEGIKKVFKSEVILGGI